MTAATAALLMRLTFQLLRCPSGVPARRQAKRTFGRAPTKPCSVARESAVRLRRGGRGAGRPVDVRKRCRSRRGGFVRRHFRLFAGDRDARHSALGHGRKRGAGMSAVAVGAAGRTFASILLERASGAAVRSVRADRVRDLDDEGRRAGELDRTGHAEDPQDDPQGADEAGSSPPARSRPAPPRVHYAAACCKTRFTRSAANRSRIA